MYHIDEENSDVIFEVNGNKVALKIVSSPGEGGGGSSIYLIKVGDTTVPTNKNTYSALRILAEIANNNEILKDIFLRKDKIDSTDYLLRLFGGLEVGEAIDSLIAGKGIIADNKGRIQADRMELRSSLTVLEMIIHFPSQGLLRVSNYWKMVPIVYHFVNVGRMISQPWPRMMLFTAW